MLFAVLFPVPTKTSTEFSISIVPHHPYPKACIEYLPNSASIQLQLTKKGRYQNFRSFSKEWNLEEGNKGHSFPFYLYNPILLFL